MSFRFASPLLLAGLFLCAAAPQAIAATCSPTKMSTRVAEGTVSSNLTTFTVIPQTAITFTQGGIVPSCVVVRFSAASSVVGGGVSRVQAVLNNGTVAQPASVQFSGENVGSVAHAFEFIFPNIPPGSHTLRMLYRVNVGGDTVFIDERTTTVQYTP